MAQRKLTALRPQKPAPKKLRDPNEKNKYCVPRTTRTTKRIKVSFYSFSKSGSQIAYLRTIKFVRGA